MSELIVCPMIAKGGKCLSGSLRHEIGTALYKKCLDASNSDAYISNNKLSPSPKDDYRVSKKIDYEVILTSGDKSFFSNDEVREQVNSTIIDMMEKGVEESDIDTKTILIPPSSDRFRDRGGNIITQDKRGSIELYYTFSQGVTDYIIKKANEKGPVNFKNAYPYELWEGDPIAIYKSNLILHELAAMSLKVKAYEYGYDEIKEMSVDKYLDEMRRYFNNNNIDLKPYYDKRDDRMHLAGSRPTTKEEDEEYFRRQLA